VSRLVANVARRPTRACRPSVAARRPVVVAARRASVVASALSAAASAVGSVGSVASFTRAFGAYLDSYWLASHLCTVEGARGVFGIARVVEQNELTRDEQKRREEMGRGRDGPAEKRREENDEMRRDEGR